RGIVGADRPPPGVAVRLRRQTVPRFWAGHPFVALAPGSRFGTVTLPWHPGFWFYPFRPLRFAALGSVALALVAPAADDLCVCERVFAAETVRDDVVDLGAVGLAWVFVVESDAAWWAVVDVVVDGLVDCVVSDSQPCCGACWGVGH